MPFKEAHICLASKFFLSDVIVRLKLCKLEGKQAKQNIWVENTGGI